MTESLERRASPRVPVSGYVGARARATSDVRLIDLSLSGARIEHGDLLRPGSTCTFQLPPAVGSVIVSTRVVHSAVIGATPMPDGDRQLRYRSGLAFVNITSEQQAALAEVVKRLLPGDGMGDVRMIPSGAALHARAIRSPTQTMVTGREARQDKEESVDAIETILSRRSIRRYTRRPVPDATVRQLLEAAMNAPSAGNAQPWQFVVITDRRILDEIPNFHPYAEMLKEAPVAILVCGDLRLEKHRDHWIQDCSAATQNILLAAHAKGLGAVWVGIYPAEDRVTRIRMLLGLPSHVVPLCLVPLGHPAEQIPRAERYEASRVHQNRW